MSDTPALKWRRMIRDGGMRTYRPTPDAELEIDFCHFVEKELEKAQVGLAGTPSDAARVSIFVLAIALLTYGRLDMADLIIANAPPPRSHLAGLLSALRDLLPLPANIDVRDGAAVRCWLQSQRDDLVWNEHAGRFETNFIN
jgi:hypothetical protein